LDRRVRFSLGRKLGVLYLGVVLLLAAVCTVVVVHLLSIRTDAQRLLEESRELALTNDLDAHFESIEVLLQMRRRHPDDQVVLGLLTTQLGDVLALLSEMNAGPEGHADPSRAEHQEEELSMTRAVDEDLRRLGERVRTPEGLDADEHAMVERMRKTGRQLSAEAAEEAEHAAGDLRGRARRAAQIQAWTVVVVAACLSGALLLALRAIVLPLKALQRHTEALGRGEFGPGPGIDSGDEIGALASAFETMASRVAATQVALERRVATRTRELARAARYADLGVLAAGVAHEINNPLASIASSAEGLQRRIERGTLAPGEQEDYLRTIASEAYRARDITQRLLALARSDPPPTADVDLRALLVELERVTRHPAEQRGVRVETSAPEALTVRGNTGELLQALVNLVLNARDASPRGGTVRVTLSREEGVAVLDVDDEGPGVPPELVERVFEPFFTTKRHGEGTGLGLSLVAAVIESHGGTVVVSRAPSGGARFRVRLPLEGAAG